MFGNYKCTFLSANNIIFNEISGSVFLRLLSICILSAFAVFFVDGNEYYYTRYYYCKCASGRDYPSAFLYHYIAQEQP